MYKCLDDLAIEVCSIKVVFEKDSLWHAKENDFGTINVYNDDTSIAINKKIFELYFKKVDE